MATVELTFSALPAHVRTARLVATAIARRTGVAEALLDEVRLAVGEACSRAVEAHRVHCPGEPIRIELRDDAGRFEVTVTDVAPSDDLKAHVDALNGWSSGLPESFFGIIPEMPGLGIAVIAGLADDVEVVPGPTGVRIRMSWPAAQANGVATV